MALPATVTPQQAPAFAELYAAYAARIARYLHRRLGPDAVEDATAEVFARALRAYGAYEPRHATPLPWLYGIAAHVVADDHRRERRRLELLERLAAAAAAERNRAGAPNDGAAEGLGDARVAAAVRDLSLADRETLLLVAWGELTYDEVALALGVPAGTVKSRLARARRAVIAAVGGEGE